MAWACFKKRRRLSNVGNQPINSAPQVPVPVTAVVSTPPQPIRFGDPPPAPRCDRIRHTKRTSICESFAFGSPKFLSLKFVNGLVPYASRSLASDATPASSQPSGNASSSTKSSFVPSLTPEPGADTTAETSNASIQEEARNDKETETVAGEGMEESPSSTEVAITLAKSDVEATKAEPSPEVVPIDTAETTTIQTSGLVISSDGEKESEVVHNTAAQYTETKQSTNDFPRIVADESFEFTSTAFRDVVDDDEIVIPHNIDKWIGGDGVVSDSDDEDEDDTIGGMPLEGPLATMKLSVVKQVAGVVESCAAEVDYVKKEQTGMEKALEVNRTEAAPRSRDEVRRSTDIAPVFVVVETAECEAVEAHQNDETMMAAPVVADEVKNDEVRLVGTHLEVATVTAPDDGNRDIETEQIKTLDNAYDQPAPSMLEVPTIGRREGRRRALTIVTNLPAKPCVDDNASIGDTNKGENVPNRSTLGVSTVLKENVPRRGRANTVIRPVLPAEFQPANRVGGVRMRSPPRRSRKGSTVLPKGEIIGESRLANNEDHTAPPKKVESDEDHRDLVLSPVGVDPAKKEVGDGTMNVETRMDAKEQPDTVNDHSSARVVSDVVFIDGVNDDAQVSKDVLKVGENATKFAEITKRRRGLTVCGVRGASPVMIRPHPPSIGTSHDQVKEGKDYTAVNYSVSGDASTNTMCKDEGNVAGVTNTKHGEGEIVGEESVDVVGYEKVVGRMKIASVRERMPVSVKPARTVGGVRVRSPPGSPIRRRQRVERCFINQKLSGIEEEDGEVEDASSTDPLAHSFSPTPQMYTLSPKRGREMVRQHTAMDTNVGEALKEPTPDWRYQPVIARADPYDEFAPKKLVREEITGGKPCSKTRGLSDFVKQKRSASSGFLDKIKKQAIGGSGSKHTLVESLPAVPTVPIIFVSAPDVEFPSFLIDNPKAREGNIGNEAVASSKPGLSFGRALKAKAKSLSAPAFTLFSK